MVDVGFVGVDIAVDLLVALVWIHGLGILLLLVQNLLLRGVER